MNRYGQQAMTHWQDTSPERVRDLNDPETFFAQMGEDLAQTIEDLTRAFAGTPPTGETYLRRVQRLTMARAEAETRVMTEVLLSTP